MKKALIAIFVAVFVLMMTGNAFAAGWWKENPVDTINNVANNGAGASNDVWSSAVGNAGATSPHGDFSTTSNKCKTCHAVHGALSSSFRLLKNDNRGDECNYCHMGPAGASKYRLYAYDELAIPVRGEHTLYSTRIPDSGVNNPTVGAAATNQPYGYLPDRGGPYSYDTESSTNKQGLFCFSCHSVHGAGTITDTTAGWWTTRILRADPGLLGDSYDANQGMSVNNITQLGYADLLSQDVPGGGNVTLTSRSAEFKKNRSTIRAAFCGGCHNRNYNFRYNLGNGQDYSLQRGSHPMGTDGMLEVGGGAGVSGYTQVSWQSASWCASCHAAPIEYGGTASENADATPDAYMGQSGTAQAAQYWAGQSWYAAGFPHQSESNKFLFDGVQNGGDVAGVSNDAYRAIDNMDEVCGTCHTNGGFAGGGAYEGVGGNNGSSF